MANASLKKDFKDGDILFSQQLNNNFGAIEAALATMNKIVWQDDPDDSVITFRGTTEEVNAREIIDGQLLYDTTTGETYIDYGSQRISTGSGNAIYIGTGAPSNPSTQLWINPEESILPINTEVVNSMEGNEANKAPSVASAKSYINDKIQDVYSTDESVVGSYNGKPLYRRVFTGTATGSTNILTNSYTSDDIQIINGGGTIYQTGTNRQMKADGYINANWNSGFYVNENGIQLVVSSELSGGDYSVYVEYTKTTDGGGN